MIKKLLTLILVGAMLCPAAYARQTHGGASPRWKAPRDTSADLEAWATGGTARVVLDETKIYLYDATAASWVAVGGGGIGSGATYLISAISQWDASVALPVGPVQNDTYVCSVSGNGWTADNVYYYDNGAWEELVAIDHMLLWIEGESQWYYYNGAAWTKALVEDGGIDWGDAVDQVGSDDMPIANAPATKAWTDGIKNWTNSTGTNQALYDMNYLFSFLAPSDASSMDGNSLIPSGTSKHTGRLSAGSASYKGGDPAGTNVNYIVNDATFNLASPNQATTFNTADEGDLDWYLNGGLNDTFDLAAAFNEGERAGAQSYPPALGAAGNIRVDSVAYYNTFPLWQKGNATALIVAGDCLQGYNYFAMEHSGIAPVQTTASYEVFYDNDAGANPSVTVPTLVENAKQVKYLSGVQSYTTNSTFDLSVVGSDCFDNVYHTTSPLTYASLTGVSNGNITPTDGAVSGLSNPPAIGETMTVTNKVLTITAGSARSTNARVTLTPRDPYGSYTARQSASANNLVDTYGTTSTALYDYLDDENRRLPAGAYDLVPGAITGQWVSATALVDGQAQVYNGRLYYPTIDFTVGYNPSQQVGADYSGFVSNQVYYRAFYEAGTPHSNGSLEFANLVGSDIDPIGSGDVNVEIKLPTQTGWLDLGTAYVAGTFTGADGDGCRTSQSGDDWGWTCGIFSTASSGYMIIVRVTIRNNTKSITQVRELGW